MPTTAVTMDSFLIFCPCQTLSRLIQHGTEVICYLSICSPPARAIYLWFESISSARRNSSNERLFCLTLVVSQNAGFLSFVTLSYSHTLLHLLVSFVCKRKSEKQNYVSIWSSLSGTESFRVLVYATASEQVYLK